MKQKELDLRLKLHKAWVNGEPAGVKADLSGAALSGANLRRADLSEADLSDADLSEANLSGTDLRWANLKDADLSGANLSGADLRWAKLNDAYLIGASLSGANLSGAQLRWAALSGADLNGANLDHSCWELSCKTLFTKADAKIVGQLLYHAFRLAHNSGVEISSIEDAILLANSSSPVTKHGCSKLHFKEV